MFPDGVAMIAHTMKGSARGIGAWRVARAAEAVELADDTQIGGALARLAAATDVLHLRVVGHVSFYTHTP